MKLKHSPGNHIEDSGLAFVATAEKFLVFISQEAECITAAI
jgi:hypothetical protein